MLLGYNTLGWYADKSLRRWDNADNKHIGIVFDTGYVPAFHLITDLVSSAAEIAVYNAFTDELVDPVYNVEVIDETGYSYLRFTGAVSPSMAEGYYYATIVYNGADTLYSDVFGWSDETSSMLKIQAVSTDIRIGIYDLDMDSFTYEGYLYCEQAETEMEIIEEGIEKPYGNVPIFNTRNIINSFEVHGSRELFKFLTGLRILEVNGTVTFTYKGVVMSAYDIIVEKKESDAFDETNVINIKFKEQDYISAINAV
jgi:hypothetical protein